MRVITAFLLLVVTASASSVASAASPPHPRLMANSQQLVALREKFKQPKFARFRQLLLSDAEALMNYQGLHPQPGKDIGEGYRAYKLAAQKKTRTLHVLPWAFFANSPNYVQTLLGGDGIWVPINDSQPQLYGAADSALLGARYDNSTLRWFSDYAMAGLETDDKDRLRNEVGPPYTIYAFVWRDEKPARKAKLPTLSRLPTLNIGCLRSGGIARPAWMVAARGHGPVEVGHEQRDTASFVLYAGGESFLLDPGYYHGTAEEHSLPVVDGVTPESKHEAPLTGQEHGEMRSLVLDATPDYRPYRGQTPERVQRNFVMAGNEAVIVLDDIVAAEAAAGNVVTRWQTAVKPEVSPDGLSARLVGKYGDVWMQTFGPNLLLKAGGPREFGKGWVHRDWAKVGRVQWHTLTGNYVAVKVEPLITVFTRGDRGSAKPKVAIGRAEGNLQVKLPSGKTVTFELGDTGWQWQP